MMARPQLDIGISSRSGVTIVSLTGLLDVATAPQVRDALLKCVADQPVAVIADLNGMELRKAYTLSVFTVVARRAAEWSGVPLLLVAGPGLGSRLDLHTRAIARFLPVFPDVDTATARRLVVATCEFWDCTDVAEDATAIASELVANAFRHAATDAELRLELRRDLLTVALTDGSAAPPARRPADEGEAGGFGLRIVESLSTTWGWAPTSDGGKIVWAVLRIHRERSNGHVRSDR